MEPIKPSEAAIERAREILGGCMFGEQALRSVALHLDHVDRVARVCAKNAKTRGDMPETVHMLQALMLPDPKPDPLVEAIKACDLASLEGIEQEKADELRAALTAAGYKIERIEG